MLPPCPGDASAFSQDNLGAYSRQIERRRGFRQWQHSNTERRIVRGGVFSLDFRPARVFCSAKREPIGRQGRDTVRVPEFRDTGIQPEYMDAIDAQHDASRAKCGLIRRSCTWQGGKGNFTPGSPETEALGQERGNGKTYRQGHGWRGEATESATDDAKESAPKRPRVRE